MMQQTPPANNQEVAANSAQPSITDKQGPVVNPAAEPAEKKREDDFKLERYKYILQQLQILNENAHKYLTLFQTLATLIVGGGTYLFVSWRNFHISPAGSQNEHAGTGWIAGTADAIHYRLAIKWHFQLV